MRQDSNQEGLASLSPILGYLNFSEGKPDSRFQKQINEVYALLARQGDPKPWVALHHLLAEKLRELNKEGGPFQEVRQAEAVLDLILNHILPAYRQHHQDLLAHLSDADLFQPFFLARAAETVLAQGPPWNETDRIRQGALNHLNDYVGYRPIAILETRPKGEPYPHERVRPIPLYIRGAGTAWGRYQPLIELTIRILQAVDPNILADASFDLNLMDELALDPRAYDQSHPASRPRNYIFGEWDPHHLDDQGRYRRFVMRDVVLEALMQETQGMPPVGFESAAVLAGTMLMASGICGNSPTAHDSTVTLSKLIPRIARCREAYYANVLELAGSSLGLEASQVERLRDEAARLKQPFGGARQHLNEYLAKHRAGQLQHRHVALIYAEMGHVEASRREAEKIPAASTRFLTEIWIRLTTAHRLLANDHRQISRTEFESRITGLGEVEDLIRRGIECGALPDPWNILGFQGMFPLSAAQEDSIRDPRLDVLIDMMEHLFDLYSRLMSEAAGAGQGPIVNSLTADMKRLAAWWDRFASVEVQDVRRVHGGGALASAEHVAHSMARWHEKGEAAGDLAFWKQYLEGFQTPKAFILVLEALLHKDDYRASMALLMTWLNQAEQVPLEDGVYSFHVVALRWMVGATGALRAKSDDPNPKSESHEPRSSISASQPQHSDFGFRISNFPEDWTLVGKFFDYLEANAEEYWNVPTWEIADVAAREGEKEESPFAAAYEDVTYQDTTDDDFEGAVAEGGGPPQEFDFEPEAERVAKRLRFISTVARLWQVAAWRCSSIPHGDFHNLALPEWLERVLDDQKQLLRLLESIHDHPIPEPMGSYESMVEYDRRRAFKGHLIHTGVATGLDLYLAALAIRGAMGSGREKGRGGEERKSGIEDRGSNEQREPHSILNPQSSILDSSPPWEPLIHRLVDALIRGDREEARAALPDFVHSFRQEPLLLPALTEGGHPKQILRVRIAQTILRTLLAHLPRLGLFRETFDVLQTAREMERTNAPDGLALTEFNHLFQAAFEGVVETIVESAENWPPAAGDLQTSFSITEDMGSSDPPPSQTTADPRNPQIEAGDIRLVEILEALTGPFFRLWVEHSQTIRVSVVEKLRPEEWDAVRTFIERYGRDLFHVKFLTMANLRGILGGGILAFLNFLGENPDPLHPVMLIDDIETKGMKPGGLDVVHLLECILEIMVEYYEDYKEYNSTSPQSDYGDKLYVFLDFIRVKAGHDRHRWQLRPLHSTHEILVAHHHLGAAELWRQRGALLTKPLFEKDSEELDRLEKSHGLRLASIAERMREPFEKAMEIDHLCALVEPAYLEAKSEIRNSKSEEKDPRMGNGLNTDFDTSSTGVPSVAQNSDSESASSDESAMDFAELQRQIESLTANPTGAGIDLPVWLARLEQKVRHVRSMQTEDAFLSEGFVEMAQIKLSLDDVRQQIQNWPPATEGS
jgi:hypothetical protein